MDLCIDIGNSRIKVAVYENNMRVEKFGWDNSEIRKFKRWVKTLSRMEGCVVSSVKKKSFFNPDVMAKLSSNFINMNKLGVLPFQTEYETPQTLGADRVALIAGAISHYPGKRVLIASLGTAITYDYIENGVHKGGNISPGIGTRLASLHEMTDRLPLVSLNDSWKQIGTSTHDAILSGVMQGVCHEITGYASDLMPNDTMLVTGGDADLIVPKLPFRVEKAPDLLMDGLLQVLNLKKYGQL